MVKLRVLGFLLTTAIVLGLGLLVALFARGYRVDTKNLGIKPSGILRVTSVPDGAQIYIDGELETVADATINLPPGSYDIEVKRDGFLSWKKRLAIEKEAVTRAEVYLFPTVPSLSAITFLGGQNPILSPDGTKVAYAVLPNNTSGDRAGLWIMDLADLPIGFSREPRQITSGNLEGASWSWSPDSRQILIEKQNSNFVVDISTFTPESRLVNIRGENLEELLVEWGKQEQKQNEAKISRLVEPIKDILERKASYFAFSPDNTKVLYTASASATIQDNLIPQLPGSSTQKQERGIQEGKTYVYDVKEDRNFLISDQKLATGRKLPVTDDEKPTAIYWFPTSIHLVVAEPDKIALVDYDGTNKQVVYAGPYEAPYAMPFPNTNRLLVLTNLGASNGTGANLYTLSLR